MSFRDRLAPLSYISPSGKSHALLYDSLERSSSKRLAIHERPGQAGALFQDLGQSPLRYPVDCYIAGADYDLAADAFAKALDEPGRGTLESPRWGALSVFPVTFSQSEDFVDGERVAYFKIDFVHAPPETSVIGVDTTAAAILSGADVAAAANATTWITKTAADLARLKRDATRAIGKFNNALQSIANTPDAIRAEINAAAKSLERTMDTIIESPVELCRGITALVRLPAQVVASAEAKLGSYRAMILDAISTLAGATPAQAAMASATLIALDIASTEAAASGTLYSRDDAVKAAALAASNYTTVLATLEALSVTDYYADAELLALLAAQHAALSAYLLDQSFTLRIERRLILDADRNPYELVVELRGPQVDLDAAVDELVSYNHLGGDALLVIPRGTEIRYYA